MSKVLDLNKKIADKKQQQFDDQLAATCPNCGEHKFIAIAGGKLFCSSCESQFGRWRDNNNECD